MTTRHVARWLLVGMSFLHSACSDRSRDTAEVPIELRVRNDDGEPLAGAVLTSERKRLGVTDGRGLLERSIPGNEGQTLLASVTCPQGYEGPRAPIPVRLTKTRRVEATAPRPTRIEATCRRKTRKLVLVVRTAGGAELPVLVEGVPAATTNRDGNAHVLVEVDSGVRSLAVTLDTTSRQDLAPKSPRRLFDLDGDDALLVMDQGFRASTPGPRRHRTDVRPRRHIPTRVD